MKNVKGVEIKPMCEKKSGLGAGARVAILSSREKNGPPTAPTPTARVNPGRFSTPLVVLSVFYVPIGRLWRFPYY